MLARKKAYIVTTIKPDAGEMGIICQILLTYYHIPAVKLEGETGVQKQRTNEVAY